ncbi:MAG: endonuclease MutS2 [Oscillospiraceae bacterium]|jgi:DNA mismatch repair protein MutS2|nr:endonuclease MutS2 [Oscillospiraceae bacterium]
METQQEKSLDILELPQILEQLAAQAVSDTAKQAARSLRPSPEKGEVRRRLAETSAAASMMVLKGSPSFYGIKDVRSSLSRADLGGMLNPIELLDIAKVLSCARGIRAYGENDRALAEKTVIDHLFASLQPDRHLEETITSSILGEDEIADAASPELATIRRQIRAATARARESLQKIISSPAYAKALQEPIITTRSERYVVPVKAEHRGEIPGLVHDVSASGATLFVEPMASVKANNELRELRAKEKAEIERILMELSAECAAHRADIDTDYVILTQLDLIFAKAKLSYQMGGMEPELSGGSMRLMNARHPLLPKETAVPITVALGEEFDTMVVTGPNTGGKTVTLKTIGLLNAMAQCGLHIPASDGSCVPVFRCILADIGDEQSIEQSLSTFSSHMTNIVRILDECGERSLVLFDELGAGTDPTEGAALAVAVIEAVRQRGAYVTATTHYAELKVYATTSPGVVNASCEFDVETLRPTYHLLVGIPGKSNAFAISRRLGLPEDIIEDAKARVGTESASFEDVLTKLDTLRQSMEREKVDIDKAQQKTEADRKEAARLRAELSVRLEMSNEKARREAEKIIADAREEAERAFKEIDRMRAVIQEQYDHQQINAERAELRRRLNEAEEKQQSQKQKELAERKSARPIQVGDVVEITAMGMKAEVEEVSADRVLTLKAGLMHITAREDEVFLLEHQKKKEAPKSRGTGTSQLRTAAVPAEIDIRGMETLEAIPIVERYIDDAYLGRLESVRIIHGKGTGALRQTVHDTLRRHKRVKGFRLGRYGEGETGVTVVELK